ncbi:hypothetical protein ACCO45_003557 [Purpureocillium lilacinum]|uniref:Uncharacterized protein n=1 Tax=Purpureocillium lilacinum TaxID=33203 RepID=A0ACC4E1L9_PURLI
MRSSLLNKRSCPVLEPTPLIAPDAMSSLQSADSRSSPMESGALKAGHSSSRVWSEIRGAIRALGRNSHSDSDGSTVHDYVSGGRRLAKGKGKAVDTDSHSCNSHTPPSTPRKGKSLTPRGVAKKLGFGSGMESSTTIVLRGSPLKTCASLQALGGVPSNHLSERRSSVSTEKSSKRSTVENTSTAQTSLESRFSESPSAKSGSKGGHNRRHPWSRSSPEGGTLQTIDEGTSSQIQPTVLTAEKAAAAKIYLEEHFDRLLNKPSARSLRRQYLESQLYYSPHLTAAQKNTVRRAFDYQESCHARETRVLRTQSIASLRGEGPVPHVDKYESLRILGKGSFGVVKLVREKGDSDGPPAKQVFAMKVIRKSDMLRSSQEGHLRAERDFLVASEGSHWIVPLVASFQDLKSLYLVMEYMPGGDFLGLLIRENILHESSLGISVEGDAEDKKKCENISTQLPWLQSMKEVLQRHQRGDDAETEDLPNLLGWRNRCGNRAAANSVVGTSQYMAPEVIRACRGCEYDGRPMISDKCKDLIFSLIQEKEKRLCSKRYLWKDRAAESHRPTDLFGKFVFPDDAEDIKVHKWFRNFPWERVHNISPPFVPHITSSDDTHYFDESEPIEDFSDSSPVAVDVTDDDVREILRDFRACVQAAAMDLISSPYDSARLRSADHRIDSIQSFTANERKVLKHFIRVYGRKERKRPRDILLRDEKTKDAVMEVRKRTAFMGYTWRRMRPGGYVMPK